MSPHFSCIEWPGGLKSSYSIMTVVHRCKTVKIWLWLSSRQQFRTAAWRHWLDCVSEWSCFVPYHRDLRSGVSSVTVNVDISEFAEQNWTVFIIADLKCHEMPTKSEERSHTHTQEFLSQQLQHVIWRARSVHCFEIDASSGIYCRLFQQHYLQTV